MSPTGQAAWARLALALALGLITWEALSPGGPPMPHQSDKLAHAGAFLLLALLADRAWPGSGFGPWKALPLLGYGLGLELVQATLPERVASLADWAADGLGLLTYALAARWWRARAALDPTP